MTMSCELQPFVLTLNSLVFSDVMEDGLALIYIDRYVHLSRNIAR